VEDGTTYFLISKKLQMHPDKITPNRAQLTMGTPFLNSYAKLLIHTCHQRGAHAIGGMAAHIPIRNHPKQTEKALHEVREDKIREVKLGHDGTWVAHPGLVDVAKTIFNEYMPTPNQLHILPEGAENISATDLLSLPPGTVTLPGVHDNVEICLQYIANWIQGNGCVALNYKMEDAATAEISRSQIWQWVHHKVKTDEGIEINPSLISEITKQTIVSLENKFDKRTLHLIEYLMSKITESPVMDEFLTSVAYPFIIEADRSSAVKFQK